MRKQLDSESIAQLMDENKTKIEDEIYKIYNNNKTPIPGATPYKKPNGEKQQYILPFDHASLSQDDN